MLFFFLVLLSAATPYAFLHPSPLRLASRLQRLQSEEPALTTSSSPCIFDWDDGDDPDAMRAKLDALKKTGAIAKWRSANFDPVKISSRELYLATRSSFSTEDYYADMVANARDATLGLSTLKAPFAVGCAVSVLFSALVVPQLRVSRAGLIQTVFAIINSLSLRITPFPLSLPLTAGQHPQEHSRPRHPVWTLCLPTRHLRLPLSSAATGHNITINHH